MEISERIHVTYRLSCAAEQAAELAQWICLEQTVEVVPELAADPWLSEHVVGRVERLSALSETAHEALISYPAGIAAHNLPQLLNVLYGNISLHHGVRITGLELPAGIVADLPGPRFGAAGLRKLLGVHDRPLLAAALKPLGRSPAELAEYARQFALAGVDVVKEDHGLADQEFCGFEQRVQRCVAAVAEANARNNGRTLYFANLIAPAGQIEQRAFRAAELGAHGLLLAPLLLGLDRLAWLAGPEGPGLPLLAHPGLAGALTVPPDHGICPEVLLGTLFRLAGADAVIFPSFGGRFPGSRDVCGRIAAALAAPLHDKPASLPAPAGGMRLDNLAEKLSFYGRDQLLLVGSDLYLRSPDLTGNAREFMRLLVPIEKE